MFLSVFQHSGFKHSGSQPGGVRTPTKGHTTHLRVTKRLTRWKKNKHKMILVFFPLFYFSFPLISLINQKVNYWIIWTLFGTFEKITYGITREKDFGATALTYQIISFDNENKEMHSLMISWYIRILQCLHLALQSKFCKVMINIQHFRATKDKLWSCTL